MMRPASIPVVAATAFSGNLPVYLQGLGTVTAFNTVTVKSRVDGQLTQVNFKEGQFVSKGQLLAEGRSADLPGGAGSGEGRRWRKHAEIWPRTRLRCETPK